MAPRFLFSGLGSSTSSTSTAQEKNQIININETQACTKSQKAKRRLSFRKSTNDSFQVRFSEQPTLDLPSFEPLSEMLDSNPAFLKYTPHAINNVSLPCTNPRAQRCLSMGDEMLQLYKIMLDTEAFSSKTDASEDMFLACPESSDTLTLRRLSESGSRSVLPGACKEPKRWFKFASWFTKSAITTKPQASHTIPSLAIKSKFTKKDSSKNQNQLIMSSFTSEKPHTIVTSSPQITKNHKHIHLPPSPIACHLCKSTVLTSFQ